jgi:hypothetical protein
MMSTNKYEETDDVPSPNTQATHLFRSGSLKQVQQNASSFIQQNARAKNEMIEYLVNKRVKNLDYLKRVHDGQVFWLNVVKISTADIERYYHPQTLQKRIQQWFFLGVSIAPLLQLENGWNFVRACSQLMEEYEYHFANVAVQGMKILKALKFSNADEEMNRNSIKPGIHKVGGTVIYEFLRTPNIPCPLDYSQVVYSFADILTLVYRKLMDDSSISLSESILKLDGRFKHHFFGLIRRDLNTLAMYIIKNKISIVESLFASSNTQKLKEDSFQFFHSGNVNDSTNKLHVEEEEWADALPQDED